MNPRTAKGWLTDAEREALIHYAGLAGADVVSTIVNIGVEYGASLVCLRYGNPRAIIIGVDIDISKVECGPVAKLIQMDSGTLGQHWATVAFEWPVDLVFIDGDHSREGVINDLIWTELVRPGGYAIFHDCYAWPPDPPMTVHHTSKANHVVSAWLMTEDGQKWREHTVVDSMRIFQRFS